MSGDRVFETLVHGGYPDAYLVYEKGGGYVNIEVEDVSDGVNVLHVIEMSTAEAAFLAERLRYAAFVSVPR